ncbi:Fatty-acid and retinol-binding protein 8 [Aphelenchoides besseyi]|nr:Fatty-acid and retinol-binding protein 8 [Aphelenchoides besseyi]
MSAQVFTVLALFLSVNLSLALFGQHAAPQGNPTNTLGNENKGHSLLAFLPPHIQALLPASVRQELSQLSVKDALVARAFIQQIPKFTSVDEARQTLRRYSPRLDQLAEQKAEKVRAFVEARRNALQPDTRTFFDKAGALAQKTRTRVCSTRRHSIRIHQTRFGLQLPNCLSSVELARWTCSLQLPSS